MRAEAVAAWFTHTRRIRVEPLGGGHINDTYVIRAKRRRYVLQRINEQVFEDPALVMENLGRVLTFLAKRGSNVVAELYRTLDKRPFYVDSTGSYWRVWHYVENSRTLRDAINAPEARAAGTAFGRFQQLLRDMPGPPLLPAIPGFLDLGNYLEVFDRAVRMAPGKARLSVDRAFIDLLRPLAVRFPARGDYIHADCKLDNLLFAGDSAEVLAIVDLDTVMRGHWAWDFGDLVRSISTTAGTVTAELFAAAAEGFVAASGVTASRDDLLLAPRYVAFMLGIRFLTDHLTGDGYFKVAHADENLARARRQFAIVAELEQQADEFANSIAGLVGG